MMRPPNLSLLSVAPKTATERGCRIRSRSIRGRARSVTAAACRGCVTFSSGDYTTAFSGRQTHCNVRRTEGYLYENSLIPPRGRGGAHAGGDASRGGRLHGD